MVTNSSYIYLQVLNPQLPLGMLATPPHYTWTRIQCLSAWSRDRPWLHRLDPSRLWHIGNTAKIYGREKLIISNAGDFSTSQGYGLMFIKSSSAIIGVLLFPFGAFELGITLCYHWALAPPFLLRSSQLSRQCMQSRQGIVAPSQVLLQLFTGFTLFVQSPNLSCTV